ncbi:MAG: DNA cytosine methyltransferase [Anaerococcus obesiensis]
MCQEPFHQTKEKTLDVSLKKLQELRIPQLNFTRPKKWEKAGEILGDNFSLAWRVLDAKYYGVPQRRRRIFLCRRS